MSNTSGHRWGRVGLIRILFIALGIAIAMPTVLALASQLSDSKATPSAFTPGTPQTSPAASQIASPQASPVTPVEQVGTFIVALTDREGTMIGGACWQLVQDGRVVAEACDQQDNEFGFNGLLGFFDTPAGDYQLVQSFTPAGSTPAEPVEITVVAGEETELIVEVEWNTPSASPAATPIASPVVATPMVSATPTVTPSPTWEPSLSPTPEASASPTPEPTFALVSGSDTLILNCRTDPSLSSSVIAGLESGEVVPVRGPEDDGWLPVTCNDQEGWVSADFVEIVNASGTPIAEPE